VTRDAHKGILIGRAGDAMKMLTSAARLEVGMRPCWNRDHQ
jgi:GTPase Era involved in 16S rRNA processing